MATLGGALADQQQGRITWQARSLPLS